MESHTKVASPPKTELKDRTLWFDGDSSFDPNKLLYLIRQYSVQFVDRMTESIAEYNNNVSKDKEIKVKAECKEIVPEWTIPDNFKKLDVVQYLVQAHDVLMEGCDPEDLEQREYRLSIELVKYKRLGLFPVLRAIIWIINKLETNNVVWGVGRGSSVSSYVLYVIGVHDVDSFAYELDIDDFLHE